MSARTLSAWLHGIPLGGQSLSLKLSCASVTRSPSGLEFQSPWALPLFAELEIGLQSPDHGLEDHRVGVVVACDPLEAGGHHVCLLYLPSTDTEVPSSNSLSA